MKSNQILTASLFGISIVCGMAWAGFGAGPTAYGASVGSGQAMTANGGAVASILAFAGGIWSLIKGGAGGLGGLTNLGGVTDLIKKTVEDLLKKTDAVVGPLEPPKPQPSAEITAEVALVALFNICAKTGDAVNLAKVSELAIAMMPKK